MRTRTLHFLANCILLSFLTTSLVAQQYGSIQANSLDLYFGGNIGYRLLNDIEGSSVTDIENRNSFESLKPNFKVGINYYIGIGESLSIKTGVRYSNPGFGISKIEQIDLSEGINFDSRIADPNNGYNYKFNYNLIGIPLGLKYVLSKRSCDPYIEFGVIPSLYLSTTILEFDNDDNRTNKQTFKEDINKLNVISFLNIGGNFILTDDLFGFTQLTANYQLNSLRGIQVSEKLVNLGVEVGLRKNF